MREKLVEELIREVYGPRNGVAELLKADPSKEYITGVITPHKCRILENTPDSESMETSTNDSTADDDAEETVTNAPVFSEIDPRNKPSAFGISFVVSGRTPKFRVCITWGRYFKESSGDQWKRKRFGYTTQVEMNNELKELPIYSEGDGSVNLYVRMVDKGRGHFVITIKLLNKLQIKSGSCYGDLLTEVSLFQPSLRINLNEEVQLVPLTEKLNSGRDHLEFLYRENPVLAKGTMCSAIWSGIDYPESFAKIAWPDGYIDDKYNEFRRPDVRSEFLPLVADPTPTLEWDTVYGEAPELSAYRLSELWNKEDFVKSLSPLVTAYEKWIECNKKRSDNLEESDKIEAENLIELQVEFLKRLKKAISLLTDDQDLKLSFCFANRAIWLQSKWKGNDQFNWKPFQLAFLLINIEPIVNPESEFREIADLLWIPTGGGKTEAYLAIMAFLMAYRRRRALSGHDEERTGGGTAILTRYTLRLLTTQQFRRVLRMVTAAEFLRVNGNKYAGWRPSACDIKENWIYGSTRFSVGLWVGGSVTPNHLRGDDGAMSILNGHTESAENTKGEPAQITRCPVCGTWISIPKSGLPEKKENDLHLLLKVESVPDDFKESIKSFLRDNGVDFVNDVKSTTKNLPKGCIDLNLTLKSDRSVLSHEIDNMWKKLKQKYDFELIPLRASRLGYFGVHREPGRRGIKFADFEIYCPNPSCELNDNIQYSEGAPLGNKKNETGFPDRLVAREEDDPPFFGTRIPIPAYTVDEQVYYRCPTVIVSTADKIARLAFEPRAASIFGNVENFNGFYGYYRKSLLPRNTSSKAEEVSIEGLEPFLPPELILQDELHLMEGPLGSMFGLYENMVEGLINERGVIPKYIASTATIKNANIQVGRLFARKVRQFPPNGLTIDQSFFVRSSTSEEKWLEETPGRIYAGVYTPGWGPHTPNIRLWSNILETSFDNRSNKNIKNYWTLVGFFNSVRELAGTRGLYRADIVERIQSLDSSSPRQLDQDKAIELSSRINSTDIPQILDHLEKSVEGDLESNPDAVFTTSMFGTGVDIPHLSLMIVNGQPKTATQYVQATGRVGRQRGALVVTFLRAGRPRDLSHYEMFAAFHQRKHLEVEPSSVNPFAEGCMARSLGPVSVSFLRNFLSSRADWSGDDALVIAKDKNSETDIGILRSTILTRLRKIITDATELSTKLNYFNSQIDRWKNEANRLSTSGLVYFEYPYNLPKKNVVLGDPYHKRHGIEVVYDNAPQSLREVEETTGFVI